MKKEQKLKTVFTLTNNIKYLNIQIILLLKLLYKTFNYFTYKKNYVNDIFLFVYDMKSILRFQLRY